MNYVVPYQVSLAEIPTEVSLTFLITGCPLSCKGCHSKEFRNRKRGTELTPDILRAALSAQSGYLTCVLFLGGEWEPENLITLLRIVQEEYGLKTALYTGRERVSNRMLKHLDYIKVGKYIERLGGLEERTTNQRLIEVKTNTDLTHKFWR